MFFKIINLKIRKPTVFLSTKLNKPTYNFSFFVFNQTLLKCLYEKNNNKTSPRINFFLNFLKKNRKYFFTDVYVFYNFLRIKDQSWNFYNFFFVNNFLFNKTIINFFKSDAFKKINKTNTKFFLKKKEKIKPTGIKFFPSKTKNFLSLNTKFSLQKIRSTAHQNLLLIFSVSKNVFNNKSSLNNYFKKYQTLAFQLDYREALSTKLFKISKMSKKLDKYQFLTPKKINFLKKYNNPSTFVVLRTLTISNQLNNFFLNRFYLRKYNPSSFLNKDRAFFLITKILKNSNFSFKKTTYSRFVLALTMSLSKLYRSFEKKKITNINFKNKKCFQFYNHYFKKLNVLNFFFLFSKPFFFKIIFHNYTSNFYKNLFNFSKYFFKKQYQTFFFKNQSFLLNNNLLPAAVFFFSYKKKILKLFQYDKFPLSTSPFHINSIIRFFEHCSGKNVIFKTNLHLNRALSYYEKSQCFNWSLKVKVFRKMLGPRLFLAESLEILYLTFKLKDPFFLSNWLLGMMKKISFWKYRLFFRYLKYVLRFFFAPMFHELNVKGIKFQLKGKISVAGNARTRTLLQKTGVTGHSSFNNKIVSELSLVPSFTGVMGLKVWIFF